MNSPNSQNNEKYANKIIKDNLRKEMKTMDSKHKLIWERNLKDINCTNYRHLHLNEQINIWNEYCPYYESYLNL